MFEWDPEKSAANLAKHGIGFETAIVLWNDDDAIEVDSAYLPEDRRMRIGLIDGKFWTVVYTCREAVIRIISVRRARDKEVREYGTQNDNG